MIALGASTLGFRHDSLDVALREIKDADFQFIDIAMYPSYCPHFNLLTANDVEKETLQERLNELGLKVATLNAGDGILGSPEHRELAIDFAKAAMQLAKMLGAYAITMQSGIEPKPEQWLEVAKEVASDVRELGNYAADLGLDLTLELHKDLLMANMQQSLDLMALVNHPNVGVALDPSHITYSGETSDEVALRLGKHVKHVHLRDGIGKNIMVVPGNGTVDFTALVRALEVTGYNRVATIELEYENAKAEQVRPDLLRAKAYLEKSFRLAQSLP
jgi:sugar phosphate isomerase/epimerase